MLERKQNLKEKKAMNNVSFSYKKRLLKVHILGSYLSNVFLYIIIMCMFTDMYTIYNKHIEQEHIQAMLNNFINNELK